MGQISIFSEGLNRSSGYDWGLAVTKQAEPDDAATMLRIDKPVAPAPTVAFHYQTPERKKGCGRQAGEWICGVKLVFDGGRIHLCGNCQVESKKEQAKKIAQQREHAKEALKKWHAEQRLKKKEIAKEERKEKTAIIYTANGVQIKFDNLAAAAKELGKAQSTVFRWLSGKGSGKDSIMYASQAVNEKVRKGRTGRAVIIKQDGFEIRHKSIKAAAKFYGVQDGSIKCWIVNGGNGKRGLLAKFEGDDYLCDVPKKRGGKRAGPVRVYYGDSFEDYPSANAAAQATGKTRNTVEKKIFSGRPTQDGYTFSRIKT